jgi:RNA polymerase primary sigma factor
MRCACPRPAPMTSRARGTFRPVLERMLDVLDERERRIITMRYGLDGPSTSSADIAATLHLSTERIRQIEARALSKLRHPSVQPQARDLVAG